MNLPTPGSSVISYNGYTWDETVETVAFSSRPVRDRANRTVIYSILSLTLRWHVRGVSLATTDTAIETIRQTLQQDGKDFRYSAHGFGTFNVGPSYATKDVNFGPKYTGFSYKPIGQRAAECEWSVEVAVPTCSDAVFRGQPMEFNFALTIDVDRGGYSTRRYSGYLKIPLSSDDGRTISDSADRWLEQILPPPLPFFRRIRGPVSLDEAKTQLSFDVTDEEMPTDNVPPPGVVDYSASHYIRSSDRGFQQWECSLTAQYEMARDRPKSDAFALFMQLASQRLNATKSQLTRIDKATSLLPIAFSMEEPEVAGRQHARFSLTYLVYGQGFSQIPKVSSLWLPTGTSWDAWQQSLANSVYHPRGNAKLAFTPADDRLINLCVAQQPQGPSMTAAPTVPQDLRVLQAVAGPCPPPEDSWIFYENKIVVEDNQNVVAINPLPTNQPTLTAVTTMFGTTVVVSPTSQEKTIVQKRGNATLSVFLIGKAMRMCYDIDPPVLTEIEGVPVTPANRKDHGEGFDCFKVGEYGHDVYGATWKLRYILPQVPPRQLRSLSTPVSTGQSDLSTTGQMTQTLTTNEGGGFTLTSV